ncbi:MAG: hypothetical protein P8N30_10680 [Tateyamaria sp.]|nr:hypothetical protein [Tateyamaria sp.]MDG1336032.1 hypothetical protein [Tateyamaria sp.]MDG2056406.1 hypothetical protein [Tateyamaria sp.]
MIDITPDVVSVVDRASIICGGTVSAAMSGHDFRMSPGDGLCLIGSGHWRGCGPCSATVLSEPALPMIARHVLAPLFE